MDDFDARRASLDLVTAFVHNNKLEAGQLPALLREVFTAISDFAANLPPVGQAADAPSPKGKQRAPGRKQKSVAAPPPQDEGVTAPAAEPAKEASKPAVPVSQSLADPSVIVSLITGERFKTLKRHLAKHGLTEAEYKARFNLPADYPTVAPAYAEVRRKIATARHTKGKPSEPDAAPAAAPPAAAEPSVSAPAKAAPKGKAQPAKKAAKKTAAPKPRRPASVSAAPADAAVTPASEAKSAPAPAKRSPKSPAAEPPAAKSPEAKAPRAKSSAAKSPGKRRMARPAPGDSPSPTPVSAPAVAQAGAEATPVQPDTDQPAVTAAPGGAPAAGGDGNRAKAGRRERKKLSVKFG